MSSTEALENYPTLFISGLPPTILEGDLVRVLNDMKIESKVVIDRDPVTSVPLGRIKIIFRFQPDAERFFATVNGSMFLGCKVHLTFKDPNMNFSNTSGSKPIVVKHMPLGVTSLEFYDTVRGFGRIISCKVMIDRSGTECYSLLQFENQDAAERCMTEMNGAIFKGASITLSWQFPKNSPYQYPTKSTSPTPRSADGRSSTPSPGWNTAAAGVAPGATSSTTTPTQWNPNAMSWSQQPTPPTTPQWQNQQGNLAASTSGGGSGQGWQMNPTQSPPDWSQGVPAPNNWSAPPPALSPTWQSQVQQQQQAINWGSPPNTAAAAAMVSMTPESMNMPPLDMKNLYIKNLEEHIDNLEIFNMFRKYGRIVSARVMRDEATGKSKGFGFVSFESEEMATRAIAEMHGRRYGAKTLVVNVAEPREFRERKLAVMHAGK